MSNDSSDSLLAIVNYARVEALKPHQRFVPDGTFCDANFTRQRICKLLITCHTVNEKLRYAEKIQKSRKRLLAILLLVPWFRFQPNMISQAICTLVDENITDEDLPFRRCNIENEKFELCSNLHLDNPTNRPKVMKALTGCEYDDIWEVDRVQYEVQAVIFKCALESSLRKAIRHQDLEPSQILPFKKKYDENSGLDSHGGFSQVWSAYIAADHQDFMSGHSPDSKIDGLVAVKQLNSNVKAQFKHETAMLNSPGVIAHAHIVDLLATYQQDGKYHLVFPQAPADLLVFWNSVGKPFWNLKTYRWILAQMVGLAGGLKTIHEQKSMHDLSQPGANGGMSLWIQSRMLFIPLETADGEHKFGRHGDIKPENILWQIYRDPEEGVLQLSDLGLSRFHHQDSRSNVLPVDIPGTSPTYSPPEIDLAIPVSRKFDIWSYGCVLLEFIIWTVEGTRGLDEFHIVRTQDTMSGVVDDTYYTLLAEGGSGVQFRAVVRQSVLKYIHRLTSNPRCSPAFGEVLNILQNKVLCARREDRTTAQDLESQLKALLSKPSEFLVGQNPTDEGKGFKKPTDDEIVAVKRAMEAAKRRAAKGSAMVVSS